MARYKLIVEYDGGAFVGWQFQDNGLSVQRVIEDALNAFCHRHIRVTAAGRTDAGVHALGQCIHFDLDHDPDAAPDAAPDADKLRGALNYHLKPHAVAVLEATRTGDDFHARFDARARHYLYRIINRRSPLTIERGRAWRVARPLDAAAMGAAARHLVGRHNFTTFRASRCQAKSPVKTLDRLEVTRRGDEIRVIAEARSFLHHQVRSMVGTLKLVGEGKWTADDVAAALAARDRAAVGFNAPPEGLYLVRVVY